MSYLTEKKQLPQKCQECNEISDCGSCDYTLERFELSGYDNLLVKKKLLTKQIERLQKQLIEVEIAISLREMEERESALWQEAMLKLSEKLGAEYLEEAERINNDPSIIVPEEVDRKALEAIDRAIREKYKE